MGQEVITFMFAWIFSTVLIDESETSRTKRSPPGETLLTRNKRSIIDFIMAIQCYNKDVNVWGTYGDYGCFCGRGGAGTPLDETDECCKIHDQCWEDTGLSTWYSLSYGYDYECKNGNFICQSEDEGLKALCDCDRAAAICFAKNYHTYKPQFFNVHNPTYCHNPENRIKLDYSVPDDIKNKRIFINSEGVLINKFNGSEAEYPKSTEVPTLLINSTTNKAQDSNGSRVNEAFDQTNETTMTTTDQITTDEIKTTSGISLTKTASSTTEEATKRTYIDTDLDTQSSARTNTSIATTTVKATDKVQNTSQTKTTLSSTEKTAKNISIDSDLDIQNNVRKNSSEVSTTSETSDIIEKTTQVLNGITISNLDIETRRENKVKHDLSYVKYSGEFTFLVILLVVVCLCLCYYFLWRYSKLPLLPLKSKSDCSFTKAIFRESSKTEKFCFGSNV